MPLSVPKPTNKVRVLGVRLDAISHTQALSTIVGYLDQPGPVQVITLNPEMVMYARRLPALRAAIDAASLVVADGIGLVVAYRLLGNALCERTTGVGLLEELAENCAKVGKSLFLLGAAPGVAERCAAALVQRFPALRVAGTYAGSPEPEDEVAILAALQTASPDLLFVAYGVPAEELWIARNRERLPCRVAIGVGGAFDFISGNVPRAPRWMQRAGLEWLYRLARQPWRWRRMAVLPHFLALVLAEAARRRLGLP